MVKGKPWTPATLPGAVGGMTGVGVTFLEDTFASPQANPRHRLHQRAAQAVLKALLTAQLHGPQRPDAGRRGKLRAGFRLCRSPPRFRGT